MADELDMTLMTQGDLPNAQPPILATIKQIGATRVEITWPPQLDAIVFRVELLNDDGTPVRDGLGDPIKADVASTFVRLIVPYDGAVTRAVKARVSPMHPNGTVYDGILTNTLNATTQFDGTYISEISADKIVGGTVQSTVAITGSLYAGNNPDEAVGGYVQMRGDGIYWYPENQTVPAVSLPTTGNADFRGVSVTASRGLDATGVILRGDSGTIADNAVYSLSEGSLPDPTTQPTTVATWPTEFTIPFSLSSGFQGAANGGDGYYWFAGSNAIAKATTGGFSGGIISFLSSWSVGSGLATGFTARDVDYSPTLQRWVAIGMVGTAPAVYTYDGQMGAGTGWTARTLPTSMATTAINAIYRSDAANLWVIACNKNSSSQAQVMTSADGITWTVRTSGGGADDLSDVSYYNSRWIAVGASGGIYTSTTGTSWSLLTATVSGIASGTALNAVAGGSNRWIAVGANGALATSTNGSSWSAGSSGTTNALRAVAVNPSGTWLITGVGGWIASSSNGTTFIQRNANTTTTLTRALYSSSEAQWAVFGGDFYLSPDAITWTSRSGRSSNDGGVARSENYDQWLHLYGGNYTYTSDLTLAMGSITGVAIGVGDASTSRAFVIGGGTIRRLNKTDGTKVEDAVISSVVSTTQRPTLFYDDSKIKVVTQAASGGGIRLVSYDPASFTAATSNQNLATTGTAFTGTFSFYGAARFTVSGTDYYAIALTSTDGKAGVYCFNATTGAYAPTLDFADSEGNCPTGGLLFNGTRFLSISRSGTSALQQHSTYHPGAATQNTFARYAYLTAAADANQYTTRASSAAGLVALPARAFLSVTTPAIPVGAGRVRVYARGAAGDDTTAYKQVSSGAETSITVVVGDTDLSAALTTNLTTIGPWGGANNTPAVLQSKGAGWKLTGDGLIVLTEKGSGTTNIPAAPSANQGVLFLRDNGSGKSQLCVRFNTGAVQVLATEP